MGIPTESPRPRYSTFIAELRKKRDHRWRALEYPITWKRYEKSGTAALGPRFAEYGRCSWEASFLLDLRRLFVAHLRLVNDRDVLALMLEPMRDRRIAPVAADVDYGELCHVSLAGCDTGIHRAWCRYEALWHIGLNLRLPVPIH